MCLAQPILLGVVILGAGASVRMGRPKLLLPWCDTTVVGHLIAQWQVIGPAQLALVLRQGDKRLNRELDRLGFAPANRIVNDRPERGMFSSIQCAANWSGWRPGLDAWALVLGDQPQLKSRTLRTLVEFQREHPHSICQPEFAGRARHPVILPEGAFAQLRQARTATLRQFLHQTAHPVKTCRIADPGLELDLDRPEDYQAAQGVHGNAASP